MPNCCGDVGSLIWMMAEIAWATMGTAAPSARAADSRSGRHSAATTTTATSAIITRTSPVITAPGLVNAFPAVMVCEAPAAVRKVKLSHEGAKAMAAPSAARISVTSATMSWPDCEANRPASPRAAASSRRTASPPAAASATPAVQPTQPRMPSTRPAPRAPSTAGVPRSATNKPSVTALRPSPSSAPARRRMPPSRISTALSAHTAR